MTDIRFADRAAVVRSRLADVEDRYLVDEMSRDYAALTAHAAMMAMQLRIAGYPVPEPPFESPLIVAGDRPVRVAHLRRVS